MTSRIVFSDITRKTLSIVTWDGSELKSNNEFGQSMVDHYAGMGIKGEAFIEKLDGWANGYIYAEREDI